MRRALSSKSKTELLNLLRDLYALTPENKGFIHAKALMPKTSPRRKVVVKDIRRGKTFEVVIKGKTSAVAPKSKTSQMAPKIRRLAQVAAELREGGSFNITRLTTLKSLCEDSKAAVQFALYLAKQTYQNMQAQKCPSHLDAKTWRAYKGLVAKTLTKWKPMSRSLQNRRQGHYGRCKPKCEGFKTRISSTSGDRYGLSKVQKSC